MTEFGRRASEYEALESDLRLMSDVISGVGAQMTKRQADQFAEKLRHAASTIARWRESATAAAAAATVAQFEPPLALVPSRPAPPADQFGDRSGTPPSVPVAGRSRATSVASVSKLRSSAAPSTGGTGTPRQPVAASPETSAPSSSLDAALPFIRPGTKAAARAATTLLASPSSTLGSGQGRSSMAAVPSRGLSTAGLSVGGATALSARGTTRGGPMAVPVGDRGEVAEAHNALSTALFMTLESIALALGAESASVFVPQGDEMMSICNAGPTITNPPSALKHLAANSMTFGVYTSGVAIHQQRTTVDDNNRKAMNLMMFPIPRPARMFFGALVVPSAGQLTSAATGFLGEETPGKHVGVLQVANKMKGTVPFSQTDEAFASLAAELLGEILCRVPQMNWMSIFYDPVVIHRLAPFVPPTVVREIREMVPAEVKDFRPAKLIHRTTIPIALARRAALADDAVALGPAPGLAELDAYLGNLSDCWKRAVRTNVDHGAVEQGRLKQVAQLRDELNKAKAEVSRLSEQIRIEGLNASDYCHEYTTLKQELDAFLERKTLFKD